MLVVVNVMHELAKVDRTMGCAGESNVQVLCGGHGDNLMIFGRLIDGTAVEHVDLLSLGTTRGGVGCSF
jgi:hypothetical protein